MAPWLLARNTWQINPILYSLFTCAKNDRLWHTQSGTRMPVQFLTDDERERLSQFPEQIQDEEITAFFTQLQFVVDVIW